jgi:hypothetical protein
VTDSWRGPVDEEQPIDRWFRHRYEKGSIYVLNIDKLICDPSLSHGALIELKHIDAGDKSWRATRKIAQTLGWWAALIEHNGKEPLFETLLPPKGRIIGRRAFDVERFDAWVCENFGARIRSEAA